MYKIFCDDTLIYDSALEDFVITKGQITKEINKSGSFVFSIPSKHEFYNMIQKMKSIITVYKGEELIFRGRVIKEAISFFKEKSFTCEGELGFLLDSVQRPFTFEGTPEALLNKLITDHNSQVEETKRFTVGTVTVTGNISVTIEEYESTLSNLQDQLIDVFGGYLFITEDPDGNRVINWYDVSPYRSAQVIQFGENLLDFTKTNRAEEIATAIIPLGYEIENETTGEKSRLTIAEINNGVDYVYNADAVELYGWIFKVETWDDETDASSLKRKGEAFLVEKIKQSITIELSAIDLSLMDHSIDAFRLGDYIPIVSDPHGLDDTFLLEKQTIDLLKADNDKITLGYSYASFTDISASANKSNTELFKTVETIRANYVTNAVVNSHVTDLQSLIEQTSTSITSEISSNYVINDELEASLSTLYTQLNDLFEFKFTSLESVVNENDIEHRRAYREIISYIRFEDGNIILGESGNELTLKIENNKISFLEGDVEVAYFSNQKLYITDVDILASLRIGNFAFIPRDNGNLSFKKIGG